MSQRADTVSTVWPLRMLPKDLGVAIVVAVALGLGLLLRLQAEGNSKVFTSTAPSFSISYPATWRTTSNADGALLQMEDPLAGSAFKTTVTVESRELDPSSPPTLQELVDRRIVQRGALLGYHFLSNSETTLDGSRAARIEYAHVEQPIDSPRSASLPVVVRSREYIVVAQNRTYYITLAASEDDFTRASDQLDRMIGTAKLQ